MITSTGTVRDKYKYKPFGANKGSSIVNGQAYRYTGKPLDEEFDLDWYYYGARYYDADGRFLSVDPLRALSPSLSPYHYAHDNPINRNDPTGMADDKAGIKSADKKKEERNYWQNLVKWFKRMYRSVEGGMPPDYIDAQGMIESFLPDAAKKATKPQKKSNKNEQLIYIDPNNPNADLLNKLYGSVKWREKKQKIGDKAGGLEAANADFDEVPGYVVDKGDGVRVKYLAGGDRLVVRPRSSEGQPTLEHRWETEHGNWKSKEIRYGD